MNQRMKNLKNEVKKGNLRAALSLAEAFKWGECGESDPRRAAGMYRICCKAKDKKLASQGYYNLGLLYYFGYLNENGEGDPHRAFDCFLQSAILSPTKEVLCRLGDMYRYGQYVERDESRALSFYLKANQIA